MLPVKADALLDLAHVCTEQKPGGGLTGWKKTWLLLPLNWRRYSKGLWALCDITKGRLTELFFLSTHIHKKENIQHKQNVDKKDRRFVEILMVTDFAQWQRCRHQLTSLPRCGKGRRSFPKVQQINAALIQLFIPPPVPDIRLHLRPAGRAKLLHTLSGSFGTAEAARRIL